MEFCFESFPGIFAHILANPGTGGNLIDRIDQPGLIVQWDIETGYPVFHHPACS
jgi:hypothetical protein